MKTKNLDLMKLKINKAELKEMIKANEAYANKYPSIKEYYTYFSDAVKKRMSYKEKSHALLLHSFALAINLEFEEIIHKVKNEYGGYIDDENTYIFTIGREDILSNKDPNTISTIQLNINAKSKICEFVINYNRYNSYKAFNTSFPCALDLFQKINENVDEGTMIDIDQLAEYALDHYPIGFIEDHYRPVENK